VVIDGSGRREVCESSRSPNPIFDMSSRVIRLLSSAPILPWKDFMEEEASLEEEGEMEEEETKTHLSIRHPRYFLVSILHSPLFPPFSFRHLR
jgi:hypothetical protein